MSKIENLHFSFIQRFVLFLSEFFDRIRVYIPLNFDHIWSFGVKFEIISRFVPFK